MGSGELEWESNFLVPTPHSPFPIPYLPFSPFLPFLPFLLPLLLPLSNAQFMIARGMLLHLRSAARFCAQPREITSPENLF